MIKLDNKIITHEKFPDGTILLKENIAKDFSEARSATITWLFENNEELVTLIYLTKHLNSHGIKNIHLRMPYIPNARQDRVKNDEDVFTLKYFAEIINFLNFTSVSVLDPHSNVSEALFNNIIVETPKKYIEMAISKVKNESENLIMFYPDEGAMKRYSKMIDKPYAFGMKKRNWENGEICGLDILGQAELVKGGNVLIIDDISSRGGTFYLSAKRLKELGANKIYLYVTHCENTIFDGEVIKGKEIEKVFTVKTIFTGNNEKIEVFDYE